jgi:hypothetical protein
VVLGVERGGDWSTGWDYRRRGDVDDVRCEDTKDIKRYEEYRQDLHLDDVNFAAGSKCCDAKNQETRDE